MAAYSGYVIYIDILFLLNFCLDFLLLWAAGRFLRRHTPLLRLLAASLLGAAYGAALVFPALAPLFLPPVAVAVSFALLAVAYRWQNAASFIKLAGVFYLIAFAMAGGVMAAVSLLQQSSISLGAEQTMRAGMLFAAVPVALIVARRGYAAVRRGWRKEDFRTELEISVAGRTCRVPALIDTGNDLREPLSGRAVIVADYRAVMSLLPERLRAAWAQCSEQPDEVIRLLAAQSDLDGWTRRLKLIPFSSIGKKSGLLLAFRPDRVVLTSEGKRMYAEAVVAIAARGLGRDHTYQAIVNAEILTYTREASA